MKRYLIIVLLVLALPSILNAQRWKRQRWDIQLGLGTTSFMGDLGGGSRQAAHFLGVRDIDYAMTRPLLTTSLRYKLTEIIAVRPSIFYGWLAADDSYSNDFGRKSRNLHFRSYILETDLLFEFSFIKERIGSRYAISRSGFQNLINAYVFVGGGWIKFNPKAEYEGQWYDLQPLGTEGQGLPDMPDKYKLSAYSIPVGIGIKYTLTTNLSLGLDLGLRYSTTDYLDDASTWYYDFPANPASSALVDPMTLKLSDRAINPDGSRIIHTGSLTEEPRGSPKFNDAYLFMSFYIAYKLKTGSSGLPKFR
jgi:hypothetical protein